MMRLILQRHFGTIITCYVMRCHAFRVANLQELLPVLLRSSNRVIE